MRIDRFFFFSWLETGGIMGLCPVHLINKDRNSKGKEVTVHKATETRLTDFLAPLSAISGAGVAVISMKDAPAFLGK